ncbi:MAG TPA: hypothetical protein VM557_14565 [Thermoanaerobaculia bacterium]|nr:hypothetical protein [Thermoanaerobaculia bacterium]
MKFREILEEIRKNVDGAKAVSLMGLDGIAIDSVNPENVPLDNFHAEFSAFLKGLRVANAELDAGEIQQFSVVTDRYITFLSAITSDYYMLVIMSAGGNYGRARFELWKAKFKLQDELS